MMTLFGSLLAASLSAGGAEIEVPLRYVRYSDDAAFDEAFLFEGERPLTWSDEKPAGTWTLPELHSRRPVFARATFGEREHLLILDRTGVNAPFYDRLFFDANANGDLTDDPVAQPEDPPRRPGTFSSPPIEVMVPRDGTEVAYSFIAEAFHPELAEGDTREADVDLDELTFALRGNCGWFGEFEHGGRTYRVHLADREVDGTFDERATWSAPETDDPYRPLTPHGDLLLLTDGEDLEERDAMPLGDRLTLGNTIFQFDSDLANSRLVLHPGPDAVAHLQLPTDVHRLTLWSEDDGRVAMLHRPASNALVPPGKWRVAAYQLLRNDDEGDLWFLAAQMTPRVKAVAVSAGAKSKLSLGEPFLPAATIPRQAYRDFAAKTHDRVEVEFTIGGAAGEMVCELLRIDGRATQIPLDGTGQHPAEPRFRIISAQGKSVAAGAFEYG